MLWGPTEATFSSWVLSCEIFQVSLAECLQNFIIRTSVFSFCKLCLQFGTESDIFGCDFRFLLDFVPVVFLSNFRSYSRGSSCCFRYYFNVFDIFRCHYCGFLRFPYDSIRFHAYNYIIPYDSMHGTI